MRRRLGFDLPVLLLGVLPELERLELARLELCALEPAPPVLLPEPCRAPSPAVLLEKPREELPPALISLLAPNLPTGGSERRGKRRRRWPREPAGLPEQSQRQRRRDARRGGR